MERIQGGRIEGRGVAKSVDVFDEREKAFEAKYRLDEEIAFKVGVRCVRLFGQWAAGRMGMKGENADAYARALVQASLAAHSGGDKATIDKVMADMAAAGAASTSEELRAAWMGFAARAAEQIVAELAAGKQAIPTGL